MSKKEQEAKYMATVLAYFKRSSRGTPSMLAEACRGLLDIYGSPEEAALATGGIVKKPESISVWARFLDMPQEVRELFDEERIRRSLVYDIVPLSSDEDRILELAKAIADLPYQEAKRVIQEAKRREDVDIPKIKQEISQEFEELETYVAMIAVSREMHPVLDQETVIKALEDWLDSNSSIGVDVNSQPQDPVPYIVRLPRRLYIRLSKKTKNPGDLLGRIIRETIDDYEIDSG